MNLEEFVKASLEQIISGVSRAIEAVADTGAGAINPREPHANLSAPRDVEFDVAVTVTDTSELGAGGKLKVASFLSIGANAATSAQTQAVSRVRFAVPVALPSVEKAEFKPAPPRTRRRLDDPREDVLGSPY